MDIIARGNFVIAEPIEAPEKNGGIYLSDSQKARLESRPMAMVCSVGGDVNKDRPEEEHLEAGHVIVYFKDGARDVYGLNTRRYMMIQAGAIAGRVTHDQMATTAEMEAVKKRAEGVAREMQESHSSPRVVVPAPGMILPE